MKGQTLAIALAGSLAFSSGAARADGPPPMPLLKRPHTAEPLMSRDGDESELPARRPDGMWLPLEITPGMRLQTHVKIGGHDVKVWLDTGAVATTITAKTAHEIGFDAPNIVRTPIKMMGAAGNGAMDSYLVDAPGPIELGSKMKGAHVIVVPEIEPDVDVQGLLGFEVLSQVDLLFAVDEGQLGVFPASKGFIGARDNVVKVAALEGVHVPAHFSDHELGVVNLVLDTGAWHSILDSAVGDASQLKVDKRFSTFIGGVDGASRTDGVYVIDHLLLGKEHVDVGPLRPYRAQSPESLLGADVTLRQRTMLSSQRGELHFAPMPIRPPTRSKSPDGKPCIGTDGKEKPCVETAIGEKDGKACLSLNVDKAWAGKHISALVDVLGPDGNNALFGGYYFVKKDVPADGLSICEDKQGALAAYGIAKGTPVSLLRFRVVEKNADECPKEPAPEDPKASKDAKKDASKEPPKLVAPKDGCVMFTGASPD